jgi:poly-gamma-glutamate capsule biosynthesis protein CapA/YwtB (metallophosphatase superfamily)
LFNKRLLLYICSALLAAGLSSCGKPNNSAKDIKEDAVIGVESKQTETNPNSRPKEPKEELYSIIGVGDIMMGTNYPSSSSLPPDDGKNMLDDVKDILSSADVTFGNLEGTLLNSGGTPKKCLNPENCVAFRMPEHYAGHLKDAGFDLLSTANNHSGDMGVEGRESTASTLEKYGIKYAGYLTSPSYTIYEKDGIKYGFTAFAPNTGTNSLHDLKKAARIVSELEKKCDIVIVSFHGGAEGTGAQHVTRKTEMFLEEDRGNVYKFAHTVVDAGADIVFGHGPHVSRGIEVYNGRLIAYSLGNFCTYKKFGLSGALGVAPILKVYVDKSGRFKKYGITSIKQVKGGIPVIDENNTAAKIIEKLSMDDFGKSPESAGF